MICLFLAPGRGGGGRGEGAEQGVLGTEVWGLDFEFFCWGVSVEQGRTSSTKYFSVHTLN